MEYIEAMYNEIPVDAFCGTNFRVDESDSLHFLVQDGVITNSGSSSWSFKFSSPIAGAWKLENNSLHPVDIFKYGLFEGLPAETIEKESLMFLGNTRNICKFRNLIQ